MRLSIEDAAQINSCVFFCEVQAREEQLSDETGVSLAVKDFLEDLLVLMNFR